MSRVLKSSQVILDDNKYKLPCSVPVKKAPAQDSNDKNKKEIENEVNAIISEKMKEIDKLYEETITNAHKEADMIISDAYEKSNEIMENARQEGFLKGKNEGFEEGKNSADSIIEEALMIKRKIEEDKRLMLNNLEIKIIDLAISTIEKILNKKIEEDRDTIKGLIQLGLEKCAYTENLVLRVSPDDYDFALSIKDKILVLSQNVSDIIIKQDQALTKGSCIIDSSAGSIDSSISTQFNQVKEMFEELLRSE